MINFYLKYIPGNVYVNTIIASLSEAISTLLSGLIVNLAGPRNSITLVNLLAAVATVGLWIAEVNEWLKEVPALILLAKFGVCAGFAMLYMSTLVYFPSHYLGAVFGICNTAARAVTILAPMVAEVPTPIPELSVIITCVVGAVLTRFLKVPEGLKLKEGQVEQSKAK